MLRTVLAWLIAALVACILMPSTRAAPPPKRVALVIGIGDYAALPSLDHPVPDALAISTELKKLGFETTFKSDLSKAEFLAALDAFAQRSRGADLVVIYFAGHGIQIAGRSYLMPTDAANDGPGDLERTSVPMEDLFLRAAAIAPTGAKIILLDACRDLVGKEAKAMAALLGDPSRPVVPGLGRIGRVNGTIYGFATGPGETASDGTGDHSPFASALIAHLGTKGLAFSSVMKIVQQEVYDLSAGAQIPYIEDALPNALLTLADSAAEPLPERDRLLLAMAGIDADVRRQIERVSRDEGVPLAPLYGALLGEPAGWGDAQRRQSLLKAAAEAYLDLRKQIRTLSSSDPEVARLLKQADGQVALGAFDAARAAVKAAIAIDHESGADLEARLRERNLSEAASQAVLAGIDSAQLRYLDAAAELAIAAHLAERWDERPLALLYTQGRATALYKQGVEFGDNAALAEAVRTYQRALSLTSRETRADEWAGVENALGVALESLGERAGNGAAIEDAIAAFRETLTVRTRDRVPLDWAMTENDLGTALLALGARASDTVKLEEAITAFRAALTERTRERVPQDWAATENNLGNALEIVGRRAKDTGKLEEAVAAYSEALKELTRERSPLTWATTENNLGNALLDLGGRSTDTSKLEEAVAAYRAALLERTHARVPLEWAATENNLAMALETLAVRTKDQGKLEEAVAAYRQALTELTRGRAPLDWATAENNLGTALEDLGDRAGDTGLLQQAAEAFREALKVRTRERVPLEWAATNNNLGVVLTTLGQRTNDDAVLEQAVAAYRDAMLELTRERVPLDWASAENNMGVALKRLGAHDAAKLDEAIAAFREALKERTRDRVPLDWAATERNLADALLTLGDRTGDVGMLEQAVSAFREALKERTRERVPLDWAATEHDLGNALETLGEHTSDAGMLEAAIAAFRDALTERTRERVPLDWAATQNDLGNALQAFGERASDPEKLEEAIAAFRQAMAQYEASADREMADKDRQEIARVEASVERLRAGRK
jgi:uncharacterized caspase-like protein